MSLSEEEMSEEFNPTDTLKYRVLCCRHTLFVQTGLHHHLRNSVSCQR
jgi:hypothetical protein